MGTEEGGEAAAEPATEQVAAEGSHRRRTVDPHLEQEESANAADYWGVYEKDEIAQTLNNLWIMLAGVWFL